MYFFFINTVVGPLICRYDAHVCYGYGPITLPTHCFPDPILLRPHTSPSYLILSRPDTSPTRYFPGPILPPTLALILTLILTLTLTPNPNPNPNPRRGEYRVGELMSRGSIGSITCKQTLYFPYSLLPGSIGSGNFGLF